MFTLPAWTQTIVGAPAWASSARASASGSIAPFGPAATGSTAFAPRPSSRSARSIVACRSSPAMTRTAGAPFSPSRLDVPARTRQDAVARGREPGVVGALASDDEAERARLRQAERLLEPRAGDLLDERRHGRRCGVEGMLVPARRENVRARGRVERPADDEAEEPRADGRGERGLDRAGELVDHGGRVGTLLRERSAEGGAQAVAVQRRRHRPLPDSAPVVRHALGGAPELLREVARAHRLSPPPGEKPSAMTRRQSLATAVLSSGSASI